MTYNLYKIHLADPGHKMQPLCNAPQLLGRILTVASLGSIQNKGVSIMALAFGNICHDVQLEMGEESFLVAKERIDNGFQIT